MSDKIRKYVLPNLPYLFVFWFFSKIGTAYRIAPGADFGTKLMGMLDTFPKAFETYWPGLGGIDLLVGLAGAAGVYLLIQSKIKQAKKFRRDAEYGTARFGTKEDIKPFVDPKFQNNVILTGTEFLTMNNPPEDTRQRPQLKRLRHRLVRFGQDKVLADPAAPSSPFLLCGGGSEGRHPRPMRAVPATGEI